jgi:hypothetical protein
MDFNKKYINYKKDNHKLIINSDDLEDQYDFDFAIECIYEE